LYSLGQLLTGLRNPRRAAEEINLLFHKNIIKKLWPPEDIFIEDWDNLILLDACRYDILNDYEFNDATFEWRWSGGSSSVSFLEYNVADKQLNDVVWVTANPWVSEYRSNIFRVTDVWQTGWDEEQQTVPPRVVVSEAIQMAEKYPEKRLVIHFMQPHYPFIGEFGKQNLPNHRGFTGDGLIQNLSETDSDIWEQLRHGRTNRQIVWQAYRENLETVLPYARYLTMDLDGKTVISSDHGNEFGEWCFPIPIRLYGHPGGFRTKNLVKVPWVVFNHDSRRRIVGGDIAAESEDEKHRLSDRLGALGYTK